MTTQPCAKINIGLNVVEKRPDGYHNLETIFYPIPLCDELEVTEATEDSMTVTGIPVAGDTKDNLVYKVVTLLRSEGYNIPPVAIRLHKNIPSGAGLGGGSSDAAYMMKMLNTMFHLQLSNTHMEQLVGRLGADCPFFIQCTPVYATGIGNIFTPITLDLAGKWLVLVKPDDFVSTKEAYSGVVPRPSEYPLTQVSAENILSWREHVVNDFERSVFPLHPTIQHIKEQLYLAGAQYACMSGSGSSVFGIFDREPHFATGHFCFTAQW